MRELRHTLNQTYGCEILLRFTQRDFLQVFSPEKGCVTFKPHFQALLAIVVNQEKRDVTRKWNQLELLGASICVPLSSFVLKKVLVSCDDIRLRNLNAVS
ncbi:MAG: hypothetical protein ACI9P7_002054 [Candidatus Azotimanducaceae bacterium]|jgi:hypothetical protein